jgi:hypothetical protein
MPERSEKFENEDIPLILATLKRAHEGKKFARVTIDFSKDGGVVSVQLETKDKVK